MHLKIRIQESEKLEGDIMQFRKNIDEEAMKSKFEGSSKVLDDILNRQRPSNDKNGLGYRPYYYSFTNQGVNQKNLCCCTKESN